MRERDWEKKGMNSIVTEMQDSRTARRRALACRTGQRVF